MKFGSIQMVNNDRNLSIVFWKTENKCDNYLDKHRLETLPRIAPNASLDYSEIEFHFIDFEDREEIVVFDENAGEYTLREENWEILTQEQLDSYTNKLKDKWANEF